MKDTFKIIVNPQNIFLKQEVWVSGNITVPNYARAGSETYMSTRKVKAFRTITQAQDFIDYQMAVAEFKGQAE